MSVEWERTQQKIAQGRNITKCEMEDLVNKVKTSKIAFSKFMAGFELSGKQIDMMHYMDTYPHTMGNFSRQTGKSTTLALWDAHELYFGKPKDGTEHWIISYGPTQRKASRIFDILYNKIIKPNPILRGFIESHSNKGYVLLNNGNKYESRTASPNTEVEGDSPTVIQIDESQGITDKQYYEGILPSGSTTSAPIHEIFTPGGRNHAYNTWISDSPSIAKVIQPWTECPFIDKAYVMKMKANSPPKKFAQEYECQWNLETGYAWNYNQIKAAAILPHENLMPIRNKTYYSGIDIGKSPDKTVHWICEKTRRGLRTVYVNTQKDVDYPEITPQIAAELIRYKPARACVDSNGPGDPIFDYLSKDIVEKDRTMRGWVRRRLESIKMSNQLKGDMVGEVDLLLSQNMHTYMEYLKARDNNDIDKISYLIEESSLGIFNYDEIVTEMISYVKNTTKSGNSVYYAEEGQHDDYPTALMLCVHAYYMDREKIGGGTKWASGGTSKLGGKIDRPFTRGERMKAFDYTSGL